MKETIFYRKGKTIRSKDGDKIFPSINKAKRESLAIQAANGGLGCGVLRVVERLPLFDQIN